MKGFPKTIGTKQDLFNCLSMVQAGELPAESLKKAVEGIEERMFLNCPAIVSGDRKTATLVYCAEAAAGQTIGNGTGIKITSVEHINGDTDSGAEDEAEADNAPEKTVITLSKALSAGVIALLIPAPVNVLAEIGVTADELNSIKVVLSQYVN